MKKINELNRRLLEQIVRMDDVSLLRFCRNILKSYYGNSVIETEDYVFAEGYQFLRIPCWLTLIYNNTRCVSTRLVNNNVETYIGA